MRPEVTQETMIINMGPQHPATHGVLRLVLELDGETVVSVKPIIGYLHTGIEKNCEYRSWMQAIAYVTRADYLSPLFNELAYCLGVERLLGIDAPPRAQALRVMLTELNRIASHLVYVATTGMELGAVSVMLYGFRERERILEIFEMITGLRMNHAFIRIGGLAMDLPEGVEEKIRDFLEVMPRRLDEYEKLLSHNPIWVERNLGVGYLAPERAIELSTTGPVLRASGIAKDVRKDEPYCGFEQYDFDVVTRTDSDCYARYEVRMEEMRQSMRIVGQALDSLPGGPVMVEDPKFKWPARLKVGPDGIGNSEEYVEHILGGSMEALIHHFKMVTEGVAVPAGEVYQAVESPRGELGLYVVSDGGYRPYRVHVRDPSFVNLQSFRDQVVGQMVSDVIAIGAALDPVMGGVDR
jgi:NADH-quinone oxidoreductase subunit D